MSRRLVILAVLSLTALGLGLRFFRLSDQSLWTDEISAVDTARAPLDRITAVSATANNSLPTYFLVLRPLVGTSNHDIEFRARWLSALAGGLSIPLFVGIVYLWRRHWGAALLGGVLLAANPLHLWYCQEVRAYALMLFFGLLTLLSYEMARRRAGRLWWGVYIGAAGMAIALHKTGLVFPVVCTLWHTWEVVRQGGKVKSLAAHGIVMVAVAATLMLKSYPPPESYGRRSSVLELGYTAMTFLGGYSFGPSLTEIQSYGAIGAVKRNLVQVLLLVAAAGLSLLSYAVYVRRMNFVKETTLLIFGVGFVALVSLVSDFPFNIRYTLPALFGFLALAAGWLTAGSTRWLGILTVTMVLGLGLWADAQWFQKAQYRKGDSRAVAEWLVSHQNDTGAWTVLPDYLGVSIEWYLQGQTGVLAAEQHPRLPQSTAFPPTPDVLIIGRRHHIIEPDQVISAYAIAAAPIQTNTSIAGFELYARKRPPNGP